MANGTTKRISDIEVGDYVWAADPQSRAAGPRPVLAVWAHLDTIVEVEIEGERTVETTEDHYFWDVTNQHWQQTRNLDEGDQLLSADGNTVVVSDKDRAPARFEVAYNLTVDVLHTYFISLAGVTALVHNDCVPESSDLGQVLARGGRTFSDEDAAFIHLRNNHGLDVHARRIDSTA